MLQKLERTRRKTSLVSVKKLLHDLIAYGEYAIKYTKTLNILGSDNSIYVFAISGSNALPNTAHQFNCQFLCVLKVLPSSILPLSGGEL